MKEDDISFLGICLLDAPIHDILDPWTCPIIRVDLHTDRDISEISRARKGSDFAWNLRLDILGIGRTKEYRPMSSDTFDEAFCRRELHIGSYRSDLRDIGMREAMVSDSMSLFIDTLHEIRIFFCIFSDDEKCCRHSFLFEDIEDLWRHSSIRSVIECENYLLFFHVSISSDRIGKRKFTNPFIRDKRS